MVGRGGIIKEIIREGVFGPPLFALGKLPYYWHVSTKTEKLSGI